MVRLLLSILSIQAMILQAQIRPENFNHESWLIHVRKGAASKISFSKESSDGLWEIYVAYETTRLKLAAQKIQLITEYLNSSPSDENSIDKLCRKWLKNDLKSARLKRKYYRQFRKVTSPSEASQFFKLENEINIYIDAYIEKNLLLQG
jgi:hypothetical protein